MIFSSVSPHLKELKKRFFIWLVVWFQLALVSWYFQENIWFFFFDRLKPFLGSSEHIVTLSLTENFFTALKMVAFTSFLMSLPLFIYQVWTFIAPGLYKSEKGFWRGCIGLSFGLLMLSLSMAHFLILPLAIKFLKGFLFKDVQFFVSLGAYFDFYFHLILAFALSFQMPLALLILGKLGIVQVEQLQKWRRIIILFIFIFAGVITPPDILSQIALAVPLVIFYEMLILFLKKKPE